MNASQSSRRSYSKGRRSPGLFAGRPNRELPRSRPGRSTGSGTSGPLRHGHGVSVEELRRFPSAAREVVSVRRRAECRDTITTEGLGSLASPSSPGSGDHPRPRRRRGRGRSDRAAGAARARRGSRSGWESAPQCGDCYNCLHGVRIAADALEPNLPIATMKDGMPVIGYKHRGGFGELMVADEITRCTIERDVPSAELAMLHCVGMCGLVATMTVALDQVASDVLYSAVVRWDSARCRARASKALPQISPWKQIGTGERSRSKWGRRLHWTPTPRAINWWKRSGTYPRPEWAGNYPARQHRARLRDRSGGRRCVSSQG